MPAADLPSAAGLATTKLLPRAEAGTLGANVIAFCEGFKGSFSAQRDLDHPFLNWIAVLEALATTAGTLPLAPNGGATGAPPWTTTMPYTLFQQVASAIYRVCWLANNLTFTGQITNAQSNAILASYNAHIF